MDCIRCTDTGHDQTLIVVSGDAQQACARFRERNTRTLQTTEVVMVTTRFPLNSRHTLWLVLLASLATATLLFAMVSSAVAQETYKTAEDAAAALLPAPQPGRKQDAVKVFGPHRGAATPSGDAVHGAKERSKFVEGYDAKDQIETKDDNNATLIIGAKDWPFPVPLVKKDNGWRFDTETGLKEILFRRIGHNELDTIQSLLA